MEGAFKKGDTRSLNSIFCLFTAHWAHSHRRLHIFSWAAVSVPEVPVLREAGCGCPFPHCCKHGPDTVCCRSGGVCRALLESRGKCPGRDRGWMFPGEQKCCWLWDVTGRQDSLGFVSLMSAGSATTGTWAWTCEAGLHSLLAGEGGTKGKLS